MSTSITKVYRVKDSEDEVSITIKIGHGQNAATSIFLGGTELRSELRDDVIELHVGKGKDIKNKSLYCTTTVTDVRRETNETSVTYKLTGGVNTFENTYSETVDNEGETVSYMATFYFFV